MSGEITPDELRSSSNRLPRSTEPEDTHPLRNLPARLDRQALDDSRVLQRLIFQRVADDPTEPTRRPVPVMLESRNFVLPPPFLRRRFARRPDL